MKHQLLPAEISHLRGALPIDRWQGEGGKELADFPILGVATHESEGEEG